VLSVLRVHAEPVERSALTAAWADGVQLDRALDGLVADGLISPCIGGKFGLPT
jgi:A/G-specific adenine glycosylase